MPAVSFFVPCWAGCMEQRQIEAEEEEALVVLLFVFLRASFLEFSYFSFRFISVALPDLFHRSLPVFLYKYINVTYVFSSRVLFERIHCLSYCTVQ